VSDALVDFSDFLPSAVEAAGAALPEDRVFDGRFFDFESDVREQNPLDGDDLTEEGAAAMARLRAAMVEGLGG